MEVFSSSLSCCYFYCLHSLAKGLSPSKQLNLLTHNLRKSVDMCFSPNSSNIYLISEIFNNDVVFLFSMKAIPCLLYSSHIKYKVLFSQICFCSSADVKSIKVFQKINTWRSFSLLLSRIMNISANKTDSPLHSMCVGDIIHSFTRALTPVINESWRSEDGCQE